MAFAKFSTAILLFMVLGLTLAHRFNFVEDVAFDVMELGKDKGFFTCYCGDSDERVQVTLKAKIVGIIFSAIAEFDGNVSVSIGSIPVIRKFVSNCNWCQLTDVNCAVKSDLHYHCVQKTANFNMTIPQDEMSDAKILVNTETEVLTKVRYFPNGDRRNNRRQVRQTDVCIPPTSMETYAVFCVYHSVYVRCTQRCIHGYTLPTGIKQVMNCLYDVNEWDPVGFIDCEPFVDCTLELVGTGSKKCSAGFVTKRPECSIECGFKEDKFYVPPKNYACNINGTWEPPLPFCVEPASAIPLRPAPEVVLHSDYMN